jgi:hypothetical protein
VGIQLEARPAAGRRSWFTPPLIDDVARGVHSAAFALAAGRAAVLVGLVFAEGMLLGPEQWTAA